MIRILLASLLCTSVALAEPATKPSTAPATQPSKYPSPTELMEKIKKKRAEQAALLKVAYFSLNKPLAEKPDEFSLFGDDRTTLRSLIDRLHQARDDKDLRGVLISIGADAGMGLAQAQEVREAIKDIRRSGKKVFVHADA